ncbi:DUF4209 domain-containing protein [Microbacterium sp. NPDC059771]|uniref:DUF4209 domain-containing protein n=1 Tax=Microbacterium sp. NPDC059771 TaxID=3346941 RepID=UPI00364F4C24
MNELMLRDAIAIWDLRPNDWGDPYTTARNVPLKSPGDLADDDVEVLRGIDLSVLDGRERIRLLDILAIRGSGRERADAYRRMVAAVADEAAAVELEREDIEQCERAIEVALRFKGEVGKEGARLETRLVARLLASAIYAEVILISDVLFTHSLARGQAAAIASHLRDLAAGEAPWDGRHLREVAANWHYSIGETSPAFDDTVWIIDSLIGEADSVRSSRPMHAADALESALKYLRTIPQSERASRGLAEADKRIKAKIDAANSERHRFLATVRDEEVDVSIAAKRAWTATRGRELGEAMHVLLDQRDLADYAQMRRAGEASSKALFFSTVHISADARTIARSDSGEIYGLPHEVWAQMVEAYDERVGCTVAEHIVPIWQSMRADHALRVDDFRALTRVSSIVPAGREYSVARALAYGYNGDFFTAAQLLAPQVENLVRVHLANAGVLTRSYEGGVQQEVGLSSLMERPEVASVFGDDLAFEIRALFCGPLGPNLRNEYAHGLVSDSGQGTYASVYAWWLMWKVVNQPFANPHHDVDAAAGREPALPGRE